MEKYRSGHNEPHSKCGHRVTGAWVRIPSSPLGTPQYVAFFFSAGTGKETSLGACGCAMATFRQAASSFRFRQQSIHLREKNIAGPSLRDQQCCALLSSQIGPAFFDEDDVCAGLGSCLAACLNCYAR